MEDDDDGANQADGAAQLAERAELFLEKVGAENGTDEDAEGAEGCDENGRGEGVGGEVADLSDGNYTPRQLLAQSDGLGYAETTTVG